MAQRRNASHPGRRGSWIPLANHLRACRDKVVRKSCITVLASSNESAPAGVTPNAKCLARLRLLAHMNRSLDAVLGHAAIRPLLARRLDRQVAVSYTHLTL